MSVHIPDRESSALRPPRRRRLIAASVLVPSVTVAAFAWHTLAGLIVAPLLVIAWKAAFVSSSPA